MYLISCIVHIHRYKKDMNYCNNTRNKISNLDKSLILDLQSWSTVPCLRNYIAQDLQKAQGSKLLYAAILGRNPFKKSIYFIKCFNI